jgi:hypothetical protein
VARTAPWEDFRGIERNSEVLFFDFHLIVTFFSRFFLRRDCLHGKHVAWFMGDKGFEYGELHG